MDGADAFGGAGKFQQGLRNGRSLSAVLPHQQQPQVSQSRQVTYMTMLIQVADMSSQQFNGSDNRFAC